MSAVRVTARKWNGDDAYSWAIFVDGRVRTDLSGLNRSQARYYVKIVRAQIKQIGVAS